MAIVQNMDSVHVGERSHTTGKLGKMLYFLRNAVNPITARVEVHGK